MYHTYSYMLEADGDYIVFTSWEGKERVEHTRWLIPGTQLED